MTYDGHTPNPELLRAVDELTGPTNATLEITLAQAGGTTDALIHYWHAIPDTPEAMPLLRLLEAIAVMDPPRLALTLAAAILHLAQHHPAAPAVDPRSN